MGGGGNAARGLISRAGDYCYICTKFRVNLSQIDLKEMSILPHCKILLQIRCHKGAGNKMRKCLIVSEISIDVYLADPSSLNLS